MSGFDAWAMILGAVEPACLSHFLADSLLGLTPDG